MTGVSHTPGDGSCARSTIAPQPDAGPRPWGLAILLGLALSAFVAVRPVLAQSDFPSRPIDIVTHASPGGGTDTTARTLMIGARQALGVNMSVLPKTGGGGIVSLNYVHNQPRDGHTILAITPTHLFAIARGQGPIKFEDLIPLARGTDDPIVIMVRGDSQVTNLEELVTLGRQRPVKWGTTQIGGVDHIAGARFAQVAETNFNVVPFSGGGEIVTNLMGGSIDAAGLNLTEALDQIRRGDFRALAVMAEQREGAIPDVPTTVELGYDVSFSTVRGYLVLRGTPPDRIAALEEGLLAGMASPVYQDYLSGAGLDTDSVAGSEVWGRQLNRLYAEARQVMIGLGIIRE